MNIKVFRDDKKLKCRLPGEEKDTILGELLLAFMFFKADQIKEKLGKKRPTLVPYCELTQKEELQLQQLNNYLVQIYGE